MDDVAIIFIIVVFLFYAAVAGAFVFAGVRRWIWPFLKRSLPHGQSLERHRHVHSTDRERSTS
jgi:hypothetical protein